MTRVYGTTVLLLTGLSLAAASLAAGRGVRLLEAEADRLPEARGAASSAVAAQDAPPRRKPDVPWVPSPPEVVSGMLELAKVHAGDVVYDLGCGDARIPIAAAREFGARAVGIELDPRLVTAARENVRAAGVEDRVRILQQDLFGADLRQATVVTLYLLPSLNLKLRPKLLRELAPGTRVVSHQFDMGNWNPDRQTQVWGASLDESSEALIYLWVIPPRGAPRQQRGGSYRSTARGQTSPQFRQ